jgi:hypothetical protein
MAKRNIKCKRMNYKGFNYLGKVYIWHEKELYRLPFESHQRYFGLLKCTKWNDGYILGSVRKSINQLRSMTKDIESDFVFEQHDDMPF